MTARRLHRTPRLAATHLGRRGERGQGLAEFALIVPLMFFLAIAVGDFGRLFTAAVAVESAAREAADYGAFLGAARWDDSDAATIALNQAEMRRRACTASSRLPDYSEPAGTLNHATCTNPTVTIPAPIHPPGVANCKAPGSLEKPCWIAVTVSFQFKTILPIAPIPSSLTIARTSTFAISDLTGH